MWRWTHCLNLTPIDADWVTRRRKAVPCSNLRVFLMKSIGVVFACMCVLLLLTGCNTSSTGVSTYSGAVSKKPVKSAHKEDGEPSLLSALFSARSTPKALRDQSKRRKTSKRRSGNSGRAVYRPIIAKHAKANGVPLSLAMAVVQVESNFRANATGAAGEIGLMQIMPRTARGIGYRGPMKALYHPETNIRYGMKYLGEAYRRGGKSTCGAILKYNAGHYAKRMNPISAKYCKRVKKILRQS